MSKFITILVEVLIFTSVVGVIAGQVANPDGNITGAARIMYGLITLFVVIGFVLLILKQLGISTSR